MPNKPPGVSTPPEQQPKSRVEIAIEELIVLKAELMQLPNALTSPAIGKAIEKIAAAVMWLEYERDVGSKV